MNKHKFYDGNTPFVRINKRAARIAFEAGKPVVFCPVKLAPFGGFRPSVMMQKSDASASFDDSVKNFEWYNCQLNETGYYTAFYITEAWPMKPFIFQHWHAWALAGAARMALSDEDNKALHYFTTTDDAINWLYLNGHKEAARALNKHVKAG